MDIEKRCDANWEAKLELRWAVVLVPSTFI